MFGDGAAVPEPFPMPVLKDLTGTDQASLRDTFLRKLIFAKRLDGADDQSRTGDLPITNRLLYQLSYVGFEFALFSLPNRSLVLAVRQMCVQPELQRTSRLRRPRVNEQYTQLESGFASVSEAQQEIGQCGCGVADEFRRCAASVKRQSCRTAHTGTIPDTVETLTFPY
jgi:hypothetical protein